MILREMTNHYVGIHEVNMGKERYLPFPTMLRPCIPEVSRMDLHHAIGDRFLTLHSLADGRESISRGFSELSDPLGTRLDPMDILAAVRYSGTGVEVNLKKERNYPKRAFHGLIIPSLFDSSPGIDTERFNPDSEVSFVGMGNYLAIFLTSRLEIIKAAKKDDGSICRSE